MDAKQCLTQNDFYFSNSVVCMSVSGKLSEVLEMGLPGLVIFFFFKAKRKERKECKRRLIYINWHVLFWPTESTPQTFPVYFTLVLSQSGAFWPQFFNPDSNYIYILFYVNYILCSLGVGEKRKILMFWKCHLFQTLFLSYAALHLHLCCQQACFPKQIQGKNRYAF